MSSITKFIFHTSVVDLLCNSYFHDNDGVCSFFLAIDGNFWNDWKSGENGKLIKFLSNKSNNWLVTRKKEIVMWLQIVLIFGCTYLTTCTFYHIQAYFMLYYNITHNDNMLQQTSQIKTVLSASF